MGRKSAKGYCRVRSGSKSMALLQSAENAELRRLDRRMRFVQAMNTQAIVNLLRKKRFALDVERRIGIRLEDLPRNNLLDLAQACTLRVQHRIASRSRFFYRLLSRKQLEDLRKLIGILQKKRVLCEKVTKVEKAGGRLRVETKNIGKSVLLARMNATMLSGIAELMGKIHSAGIEHSHPHRGNIVVDRRGRIGIIDLIEAETKQVEWESAQSIFLSFKRDYNVLWRAFRIYFSAPEEARAFFSRIISRYPASKELRRQVIEAVENFVMLT
ncbi:MAG: hypothetical protein WC634_04710 [archaeon]